MVVEIVSLSHVAFICVFVFFFTDTATTDVYTSLHTLSLHDALPILLHHAAHQRMGAAFREPDAAILFELVDQRIDRACGHRIAADQQRSEEHTSELQSLMRHSYAVFCLKQKTQMKYTQLTFLLSETLRTKLIDTTIASHTLLM